MRGFHDRVQIVKYQGFDAPRFKWLRPRPQKIKGMIIANRQDTEGEPTWASFKIFQKIFFSFLFFSSTT